MSTTEASPPSETPNLVEPFRAKSGWIVALGVIYVIAGFIALGSVVMATVASVFVVGLMMLAASIVELFNAFHMKTWGRFIVWLLLGVLYIIAGVVTLQNPLFAAAVLTLTLGFALIASGLMRIVAAFSMKMGMAWMILSGLITLLLGLVIVAQWPFSSVYILGLFLGIDLIFAGIGRIALGLGMRRATM